MPTRVLKIIWWVAISRMVLSSIQLLVLPSGALSSVCRLSARSVEPSQWDRHCKKDCSGSSSRWLPRWRCKWPGSNIILGQPHRNATKADSTWAKVWIPQTITIGTKTSWSASILTTSVFVAEAEFRLDAKGMAALLDSKSRKFPQYESRMGALSLSVNRASKVPMPSPAGCRISKLICERFSRSSKMIRWRPSLKDDIL